MSYSTSASPPPSSPAMIRHRSFIHELQAGHNAAEQLRCRLTRSPETEDRTSGITLSDLELAERIFNSFNNSLAIARNCESLPSSLMHQSGEESGRGESSRIKDRRGCYKRRKRGQSWATEGEAPNEDGHAWRKYGQKMILKSKFPRNYYRCTHKTDQGCLAIKQVQKLSDEPPRYKTTYSGVHTCKTPHKTPEIMIPSSSPEQSDSSILLSFDRTTSNPHHISPFFQPSIKEEYLPSINVNASTSTTTTTNEAMMMNMMMMITQSSTSSDYNYLSSRDPTGGPHLETSDYGGDVISVGTYSCSASPPSPPGLEIDNYMMLEGQDHLDLIQFD